MVTPVAQPIGLSPMDIEAKTLALCRTNAAVFVEYVMRHERMPEGHPKSRITLQPYHIELATRLLTGKAVVTGHNESGKSQIAVGLVLWLLGVAAMQGQRLRVAWVSETQQVARKFADQAASYILGEGEGGRAFKRVFPALRAMDGKWSSQDGYHLDWPGVPPGKDASICALGMETGTQGRRIDIAVFDDYLTLRTTRTAGQRAKALEAFDVTFLSRMTDPCMVWFLCNAFHEEDVGAVLESRGWPAYTMTVSNRTTGELHWPDVWTQARIDAMVATNPHAERILWCRRRRRGESSLFKAEAVAACKARGQGLGLMTRLERRPPGSRVIAGVDLATSQDKSSDDRVIFVILRHADGSRQPIHIRRGKWRALEFLQQVDQVAQAFPGCKFVVETNQAQRWVAELTAASLEVDVEPHVTTGKNKWDPVEGVESIATEFGLGRWIIPCDEAGVCPPLVEEWLRQCDDFDPEEHTGDLLMGSWFAQCGARNVRSFQHRLITGDEPTESPGERPARDMQPEPGRTRRAVIAGVEAEDASPIAALLAKLRG